MKATNIIWDVDYDEGEVELPTEIEIPNGMTDEEEISDYITDETGFCHCGFELVVGLCTFPDDDKDYCKYFEVPKGWLLDIWEKWTNNKRYIDLDEFLDNYVWDETWFIYNLAKDKGILIVEKEEA